MYTPFFTSGVEIELTFALCPAAVGMYLAIDQSPRSCTYTRCLSQGSEIELIFVQRAAVSKKLADFQFDFHIWA